MIQVNRIYLIFNRLVTKKFLVDTSVVYSINFVLLCSCFIINRYHMAFYKMYLRILEFQHILLSNPMNILKLL